MRLTTAANILKRASILTITAIAVGAVVIVGVNYFNSLNTPKATALEFMQKLAAKDYAGARNLGSTKFQQDNTAQDIGQKLSYLNASNDQFQANSSETSIDGTAAVVINLVSKDQRIVNQVGFKLVKVSDSWRVDALQVY